MAVLRSSCCWGLLAVLVQSLWLAPWSSAWQIATDHITAERQIRFDWAGKEGTHAELADTRNSLGIPDGDQNRDVRKEYEEALRTYRQSAQKDPETYLPYVAATLNNYPTIARLAYFGFAKLALSLGLTPCA